MREPTRPRWETRSACGVSESSQERLSLVDVVPGLWCDAGKGGLTCRVNGTGTPVNMNEMVNVKIDGRISPKVGARRLMAYLLPEQR